VEITAIENLGDLGMVDEVISAQVIDLKPGEKTKLTRDDTRKEYLLVVALKGFGTIKFDEESSGDYMVAYYNSPRVQLNDPKEVTLCALKSSDSERSPKPLSALVFHMRFIPE